MRFAIRQPPRIILDYGGGIQNSAHSIEIISSFELLYDYIVEKIVFMQRSSIYFLKQVNNSTHTLCVCVGKNLDWITYQNIAMYFGKESWLPLSDQNVVGC